MHYALYPMNNTLCTTPYTLRTTPYALYPLNNTLYHIPYILYPIELVVVRET